MTQQEEKRLVPKTMFILYKSGDVYNNEYFIEVADIDDSMNVLTSKPLTKEVLQKLVKELQESETSNIKPEKEIFPDNLIYTENSEYIVWHVKARKAKLNILGKKQEYNLPDMIFKLDGQDLYIFVVENGNIGIDMELYKQVFPNIYDNNKMCFGNCKHLKTNKISEKIKYYTDFFFKSEFTASLSKKYEKYFEKAKTGKFPQSFFKEVKSVMKLKDIL